MSNKFQEIELSIQEAKQETQKVIENVIDRGDRLEDLDQRADNLKEQAIIYSRQSKMVRRETWKDLMCTRTCMIIIIFIIFLLFFSILIPLTRKR